jgi:hypothetical protein
VCFPFGDAVNEGAAAGGLADGGGGRSAGAALAAGDFPFSSAAAPPAAPGTGASADDPIRKSDEIADRTKARNMTERRVATEWGASLTQNRGEDNGRDALI